METSDKAGAGYPPSSAAFEWLMAVLAYAIIGGLNLDFWAHNHGRVDESFFTPWHTVLYGSMALNGIVLGVVAARNVLQRHFPLVRSLPRGYGLSLIGVLAFSIGGALDLVWHTLFGIEEDIQALLSPTHLFLAVSAALIITGPLRSAAARIGLSARPSWVTHGPIALSIVATVELLGYFTAFAHPLHTAFAVKDKRPPLYGAIYVTHVDGSQQTRVVSDPDADEWGAVVSPDGKRIAYRRDVRGSAQGDIYVADIDGSHPARLTHSRRHDTQPAWSPDGRGIAYISAPPGTSGEFMLEVVPAKGGAAKTLVTGSATLNGPSWSADGKHIVFGSRHALRDWIAIIPVSGGAITLLDAGADGSWPAWRPHRESIVFVHNQSSEGAAIFVMDAGGKKARQISATGMQAYFPAWSPDGAKIAFTSSPGGPQQVYVMNADGSDPKNASRDSGLNASRPGWTKDGRIIFAASGYPQPDNAQNQSLAIGSFLLQTIVLMGLVLLFVRRWRVPFGAMTIILTANGFAMASTSDQLSLLPWIIATGIAADIWVALIGARVSDGLAFYAFAFGLPLLYTALYETAVASSSGLGWPLNLVLGTPVICGVAGLLLAYAFRAPLMPSVEASAIS